MNLPIRVFLFLGIPVFFGILMFSTVFDILWDTCSDFIRNIRKHFIECWNTISEYMYPYYRDNIWNG